LSKGKFRATDISANEELDEKSNKKSKTLWALDFLFLFVSQALVDHRSPGFSKRISGS